MSPEHPRSIDERKLIGRWIHSDEEDEDGELVFRSPDFEFAPRRRPRQRLTLEERGRAETGEPGPADRPEVVDESWTLEGDRLSISGSSGVSGSFQVVHLEQGKLVLRRVRK